MSKSEYLLEMNHISKSFPGVKALDDVSIRLKHGEVLALVGENGAGKSTLMNILLGQYAMDSGPGEILLEGERASIGSPVKALGLGISMIYQELNPVLDMDIASNIFLHREDRMKGLPLIRIREIEKKAKQLLDRFGMDRSPRTVMRKLSVAECQMVEIIKAISYEAKIIVMDEPTSSLTEEETAKLFETIRRLRAEGTGIIYISHRMDEIFDLADSVTILRDGKRISTHGIHEITRDDLITSMVGRKLDQMFPKIPCPRGEKALEVKNLTRKGVFEDISFSVHAGEILGLSGLVGAGRSEIVKAIFGLDPYDSGEILLDGKPVRFKNTRRAIDHGIAMVSEDRRKLGLVLSRSIMENATLAHLKMFIKGLLIRKREESAKVGVMVDSMALKRNSLNQPAATLSGGNQQKVILAKWLMKKPRVMILDEPTRGIDVGAKAAIHRMISQLAGQGMAIIMISSELPEILGMSDRILVVGEGAIRAEFSREEATQENILTAMLNVKVGS